MSERASLNHRDMQQVYGPITVILRVATTDYYAYITESEPRIGVIGRSLYEAVGDLVVHHPEYFALSAPVAEGPAPTGQGCGIHAWSFGPGPCMRCGQEPEGQGEGAVSAKRPRPASRGNAAIARGAKRFR